MLKMGSLKSQNGCLTYSHQILTYNHSLCMIFRPMMSTWAIFNFLPHIKTNQQINEVSWKICDVMNGDGGELSQQWLLGRSSESCLPSWLSKLYRKLEMKTSGELRDRIDIEAIGGGVLKRNRTRWFGQVEKKKERIGWEMHAVYGGGWCKAKKDLVGSG